MNDAQSPGLSGLEELCAKWARQSVWFVPEAFLLLMGAEPGKFREFALDENIPGYEFPEHTVRMGYGSRAARQELWDRIVDFVLGGDIKIINPREKNPAKWRVKPREFVLAARRSGLTVPAALAAAVVLPSRKVSERPALDALDAAWAHFAPMYQGHQRGPSAKDVQEWLRSHYGRGTPHNVSELDIEAIDRLIRPADKKRGGNRPAKG